MESTELVWEMRDTSNYIWLFIPLLVALFLVVALKILKPQYIPFLSKATFNNSNVLLFAKQDLHTGRISTYTLLLVHALSFSVGAYVFINEYLHLELHPLHFLYLLLGFLFFLWIKQFFLSMTSWIAETKQGITENKYNLFIFFEFFSLLTLTLAFGLLFTKGRFQLFIAESILALQVLIYLIFLLRGIFIANQYKVSFLYIFLYICTLEILPLVVIFYTFSGNFNGLSGL